MTARRTKRMATTVVLTVVGLLVGLSAMTTSTAEAFTPAPRVQSADPGSYQSLDPTRILDTRIGNGAPEARIGAGDTLDVTVSGRGGIPASGVSAVVFNLTVVRPGVSGYVSAFPAGQPAPVASSINFEAAQTRAHLVIVAPGASGQVALRNASAGPVDLLADVVGYYTAGAPTAGGEFAVLNPTRILDTRIGLGATRVGSRGTLHLQVTGRGGVPSAGVGMVAINLTATRATTLGYLAAWAGRASGSNVNFQARHSASNLVIAPVSPSGTVSIHAGVAGQVDMVADVLGYYLDGAPSAPGRSGGVSQTRLLDTRVTHTPIPAFGTITLAVVGQGSVPDLGVTAAALNVTAAEPTAAGYLTVYPSDIARPTASTVNFATNTLANLTLTPLGTDGAVHIYNGSAEPVQVVVDVSSFVGPIPGPLTWSGRTPIPGTRTVMSVSCGSPTFCFAFDTDGAYRYDGHTWSAIAPLTGLTYASPSCVASGFCATPSSTGVYTYDGHAWTLTPLSDPADPSAAISAVSCTSATFCVALESGETSTSAWIFDGSHWTNSGTGIVSISGGASISCASTTFCLVVDGAGDTARFDGTSWTAQPQSEVLGVPALSCVTASFCAAVSEDTAASFDGAAWSPPTTVNVQTSEADSLSTVSCTSATMCLATTYFGFQLVWDGTSWSSEVELDPTLSAGQSVSCVAPQFCAVVGLSAAVVGD